MFSQWLLNFTFSSTMHKHSFSISLLTFVIFCFFYSSSQPHGVKGFLTAASICIFLRIGEAECVFVWLLLFHTPSTDKCRFISSAFKWSCHEYCDLAIYTLGCLSLIRWFPKHFLLMCGLVFTLLITSFNSQIQKIPHEHLWSMGKIWL